MTHLLRPATALAAAAIVLSSCSTVNTAIDRSMNVFRGKPKAAAEEPLPADAPGAPATPAPGPSSAPGPSTAPVSAEAAPVNARWNHAVMMVEVNGTRRRVVIELKPDAAPKTVANFKKLISRKFYDGLAFHRAIRNFVVQTGDPATRSDDQKDQWGLTDVGYKLAPELKGTHVRGAVAMARPGDIDSPDKQSSGSQFYVCLVGQKRLDGNYTVFGQVVQGLEVLEAVSAVSVDTNDTPTRRVTIQSIRLAPPDSPELQPESAPRRKTKPDADKGRLERLFDRIW